MTYPTDDAGHPQVDFVWGNFPLQPNDERGENTLDYSLDNHVIADIGWSNYPAFIPDYSGDEDSDIEYIVPDLVRKTRSQAEDLLQNHNTDLNLFDISHRLTVNGITTTGTTVRLFAWDTDNPQEGAYLNGLRVGDQVYINTVSYGEGDEVNFNTVTVTKVNEDGENSWFEFKVDEAFDPALDSPADASVFAGPNLVNVITVQRFWNAAGSIKNEGTNVHVRYFEQD